jgi:hypothetical protein
MKENAELLPIFTFLKVMSSEYIGFTVKFVHQQSRRKEGIFRSLKKRVSGLWA